MSFEFGTEVYHQAFPDHGDRPNPAGIRGYISYGIPFPEACAKHVDDTFHATRVYIIASRTLAETTSALELLKGALESKVVGVRVGMTSHTLWSECVDVTNECRKLGVDLIVTLGGGSLTDAAKLIALALANDIRTSDDLNKLPALGKPQAEPNTPEVPIICIPTTLSGGEYTNYSGATEDATRRKYQFGPPLRGPALVILDPKLTITMPDKYWLSTGVRAVDHCVESLCALAYTEQSDADAKTGLKDLVSGLLRCKADNTDLDARLLCQLGVVLAIGSVVKQVRPALGASHAIGHMLGPLGVGHGETSCIILPAVCKFNAAKGANVDRQTIVLRTLWELPEVRSLGLHKDTADLGDVLDALFRALGMPRTLKAVGVEGARVERLAENTLHDTFAGTNPYPLKTKEDVMEILELVRG
ncbi:Dehydroquinate synthase-like protein [Calocera viscosa TUFC12733]|uniref:Dehydroquinate synthase-like protein n=1 Tax=Calocera viscosa (strain TUFC12733) TaxID=1330018 RepID=A0A167HZ35_CALVF|nr:Dehydroquinate synthase-like protein [Calocera viscosa TUFC12733]